MPTLIIILSLLRKYWQLILIVILALYIVISGNSKPPLDKNSDKIDSIIRILNIPQKQGSFNVIAPKPVIVKVPQLYSGEQTVSAEMLKLFTDLKSDNAKTKAYAEAIALKIYRTVYQDSTVSIVVRDSIEGGMLKYQAVDWKVKPQQIKYYENVYYMKPQFVISAGVQFQTRIDSIGFSHEQVIPKIGFKGRNGWKIEAGVNVLNIKEYMIGVEKDLFTKYRRIEEKKQF